MAIIRVVVVFLRSCYRHRAGIRQEDVDGTQEEVLNVPVSECDPLKIYILFMQSSIILNETRHSAWVKILFL